MLIWIAAVTGLAFGVEPSAASLRLPPAVVSADGGEFVDRTGAHHPWEINRAHALLWDHQAYIPAGVLLHLPGVSGVRPTPASPQADSGDTSPPAAADAGRASAGALHDRKGPVDHPDLPAGVTSALDVIAAHGVKDLCVVRDGGWLAGDGAGDQALVDALEARGVRYGIALDARPSRPLAGYLAVPTRIEVPASWRQTDRRLNWSVDLPGARAALFALIDVDSDSVIAAGRVPVSDGKAHVEVTLRPSRRIFAAGAARLVVIPETELAAASEDGPVDFWSAWEDTQGEMIRRLAAVKWGPGLRFFARPAAAAFGLHGEAEDLVPSSGGFRLAWAGWLEKRYSISDLNSQWALNDRQVAAFGVAARLVPTWGRGERAENSGWLLDPISGEWYRTDLRRCAFWRDFEQFRTDSIRQALNSTATLLKKVVADVPVVEEWTEYDPLFTDPGAVGGLDGLAFISRGWGQEAATGTAAYAYAQAEESARPTWFLQLGQQSGSSAPPGSAAELQLDWNWLREIGCKGFFADGVTVAGSAAPLAGAATSAVAAPGVTLDWVHDYAQNVATGEAVAAYRPPVLYFPSRAVGLSLTGRTESGVWWLPSFAAGEEIELGNEMAGYWIERSPDPVLSGAAGGVVVLWTTGAPRKATFFVPPGAAVGVYDAAGRPVQTPSRRSKLQVALDANPSLVTGLPLQNLFPVETASSALRELDSLIKEAEAQKLEVAAYRLTLNDAHSLFAPATAAQTYALIRTPLAALRAALTPYLWLEGEAAARQNWNGVQPDPQASGGAFLHLERRFAPEGTLYEARYSFRVTRPATYDVWFAGSVPGGQESSPFTWRVDDRPPSLAVAGPTPHRYATSFGWTQLGQVSLEPGAHTLILSVTGPAPAGGYRLDADALVLSRVPFQPDGVHRPGLRVARDPESRPHDTR